MSQTQQILEHLESGRKITALDALNRFNCFRLAARIADIKALGHTITRKMVKVDSGKMVAEYGL